MDILFDNTLLRKPVVSLILLDWTCRESFHFLTYINNQNVPRDQYEVIWIEYYSRRSPEIQNMLDDSKNAGKPPAVDKWIVMDMPEDVYYHKHLMYNIGIVVSKGEIIVICDSDAIVTENFVKTIIDSFREDPNIVLHLDEFRNNKPEFHPFNYPTIEEILGEGCINNHGGKTTGVLEVKDPIHVRNYGACMCAKKADIIAIGGADEHIDYLGHICGPYDMTFRLMNLGKKEIWHMDEFLYHTWHPGQAGVKNYLGPHDGRHMSTTSLESLKSGRILPLLENGAIQLVRTGNEDSQSRLIENLIRSKYFKDWSARNLYWTILSQDWHVSLTKFVIRCVGFKNREFVRQIKYQLPIFSNRYVENPVSVGAYRGYNFVKFRTKIYGIQPARGPVDFFYETELEHPDILCAGNRKDLKKIINRKIGDP